MADRIVVNRGICVASALALLVAVMIPPLRSSGPHRALSPPDGSRHSSTIPPARSASLSQKSITLRAAPVKAVNAEDEEEKLSRAACPVRCAVGLSPSSPLKTPARASAALGFTRPSQPLRC